ncbi:MAG: MurR/RpiR family transcriptional regulator [Blautia massiliensis (ex Durand et al. 2017)]
MKIEQLIREKVSFLSAGQKKVAEYILQHLDSFSYSTLAKLSKEISVSETTIIRLAYSLGFESFSEMQRTVQNDILSIPTATADDHTGQWEFLSEHHCKRTPFHGKLGFTPESG